MSLLTGIYCANDGNTYRIQVEHVSPSAMVPLDEYPGAVDADVVVNDIEGGVTLVLDHDGRLNMWGPGLDCWASMSLHELPADVLQEVVAHVRHEASR